MATGYTYPIADGTVTDFPTFALQCARAFGALVEMREAPMDAPIPESFQVSDYHAKALVAAQEKLAMLRALTSDDVERRAEAEFREAMVAWELGKQAREEKRHRYQSMLDKVKAWAAPTHDHDGLKNFMVQQLTESIRCDCDHDEERWMPKRQAPAEWWKERLEYAQKDVEYHRDHDLEERTRADGRTEWMQALRRSLSESATVGAVR